MHRRRTTVADCAALDASAALAADSQVERQAEPEGWSWCCSASSWRCACVRISFSSELTDKYAALPMLDSKSFVPVLNPKRCDRRNSLYRCQGSFHECPSLT